MLHEILLSLSGHPSPLLRQSTEKSPYSEEKDGFPLLSPPERALLASLAHLSQLHVKLRKHTQQISSSHPSTICRSVSSAIVNLHLGSYQQKILEVEKSILSKDAGYVGGYGIVPLSTIVAQFAPWVRRLEWLWDMTQFMLPISSESEQQAYGDACTGPAFMDQLRKETHTGYKDIEEMALSLVQVAELAWVRQMATWILYGRLPSFGTGDFFVRADSTRTGALSNGITNFRLEPSLLPDFVTLPTASSILFIGKSLNHIAAIAASSLTWTEKSLGQPDVALLPTHLEYLTRLTSPVSSSSLSNAISEIRLSLSQHGLSQLLPLPKILESLSLLQAFLLLGRGEFAVALINIAEKRVQDRSRRPGPLKHKGIARLLDGVAIKEGEVTGTLDDTWIELLSLKGEEDAIDDELERARELLQLSLGTSRDVCISQHEQDVSDGLDQLSLSDVSYNNLLFPSPTAFSVRLQPPLDLFLSTLDIYTYSSISAYLLGIRRADLRLSELWKHTPLRRCYPTPLSPPLSNSKGGQARLKTRRARENTRGVTMRPIWATGSAALFVLSELGSYLQNEVVRGHWQHFRNWVIGSGDLRPGSSSSAEASRPGTASSRHEHNSSMIHLDTASEQQQQATKSRVQHDPETLSAAHRAYLNSLSHSLLLTDTPFTRIVRDLLTSVDHFIALITNLQTTQQNLDLEADEGVYDSLADYAGDEKEILRDLSEGRSRIEEGMKALTGRLREIDESRVGDGRDLFSTSAGVGAYVAWRGASVDRLLMKLDFEISNVATDEDGDAT